jgi:transposase-like protein
VQRVANSYRAIQNPRDDIFADHNLNNVMEQDHRTVKKRTWLAKGYGSFPTAWRTLQGIEAMQMIRKGRVRWLPKGDSIAQASFIAELFGIAA